MDHVRTIVKDEPCKEHGQEVEEEGQGVIHTQGVLDSGPLVFRKEEQ